MTVKTKSASRSFYKQLDQQILTAIVNGDTQYFQHCLDDYEFAFTNPEEERLKLLFQAGFERGIRIGSKIVMDSVENLLKTISEG